MRLDVSVLEKFVDKIFFVIDGKIINTFNWVAQQPLDQILDVVIMFKSELMRAAAQLGGWSLVQLQQIL